MATIEASVEPPAKRRRWAVTIPFWVLILLAAATAIAAAVSFVAQYEPLEHGSISGVTYGGARFVDTLGDPDTLILLDHEEGGEFFAQFTIRNKGPLAVTLVGLGHEPYADGGPFYPAGVVVHPGERFTGGERVPFAQWDDFEPFHLGAGDERRVAIRYRFGRCNLGRGGTIWVEDIPATFSVIGLTRHTDYKLPYTLAMRGTSEGCP